MGRDKQILAKQYPDNIPEFYDKYSGMLFGYIHEVVKDPAVAEQQLLSFYITIKDHLHELNADGINIWCQLQRLLKKHLYNSNRPVACNVMINYSGDKYLGMMSNEQRYVFYSVYYHGKSVAELSCILNKPKQLVSKDLKDAFAILR